MNTLQATILALCLISTTMANPVEKAEAYHTIAERTEQFSNQFFQAVSKKETGNLISSPLSANIVLSMAAVGARGNTEKQFTDVLHLPSTSVTLYGYQGLVEDLNSIPNVELRVANKMYVADSFPLKEDFKEITQTYYHSASENLNFGNNVAAANTINNWCQQQTNNRIKDIVKSQDLSSLTAMVLLNAVYFKGRWKTQFNPKFTMDHPFYVSKQVTKNVPTMFKKGTYNCGDVPELNAKYIELPYEGDDLSMVIIVPNEIDGLASVESKLQQTPMSHVLSQGYEREVKLYLPKFKIESEIDLKEVLTNMGLTDMFTDFANFSGISDIPVKVSKAVQKAFIEVNEEGSEAAAVTDTVVTLSLRRTALLEANRPFFYAIVRKSTGNVVTLFTGHVYEPQI